MSSSLTSTTLTINGTQSITGIKTTLNNSNSEVPTSKAVKDFVGSGSFIMVGNWANPQYTGFPVDYTGLIFLATLPNGNVINATVSSISPSTWSSTVGTQTATFTCTAEGFSFTATKTADVVVPVDPVLNNNSWALISDVAKAGTAAQYWSVGDYKNVSVAAGTVGSMSIVAGTYRAVIIGINHNPTYENAKSIDFCIGQNTSGTEITFMNDNGIGIGASRDIGWIGSTMYLTYLPQFYNLLSDNAGLQDAMIAPKKYTNNKGPGTSNNSEANVTLSEDANYKMFLMAEFEIFGTRTNANSYEQNKQAQYAYYSSTGLAKSKIRYRTDTGEAFFWWERSADCRNNGPFMLYYWCNVRSDGTAGNGNAVSALVPCFRV